MDTVITPKEGNGMVVSDHGHHGKRDNDCDKFGLANLASSEREGIANFHSRERFPSVY